jgi:folate-binding protein YgfZ
MGDVMPPPVSIDAARLANLRTGAVMIRLPAAVLQVHGPGALQCLQGLLTNDLVQPGNGTMVYTALLTPKGMILADMWVLRMAPERLLVVGDQTAARVILGVFQRSMPARMALVDDLSERRETLWLCGDQAWPSLVAAGFAVPDADNRFVALGGEDDGLFVARPHTGSPFRALLLGTPEGIAGAMAALARAGVTTGNADDLEAARILSGWPRLGTEIQDKTLPQEVRYDDIQGLSYTKGCYLGQETVARLHFRGHTNRELRGLVWQGAPPTDDRTVRGPEGTEVGTVGSLLVLPDITIGLAILRREIHPGDMVSTGDRRARVVSLPFSLAS